MLRLSLDEMDAEIVSRGDGCLDTAPQAAMSNTHLR